MQYAPTLTHHFCFQIFIHNLRMKCFSTESLPDRKGTLMGSETVDFHVYHISTFVLVILQTSPHHIKDHKNDRSTIRFLQYKTLPVWLHMLLGWGLCLLSFSESSGSGGRQWWCTAGEHWRWVQCHWERMLLCRCLWCPPTILSSIRIKHQPC